MAILPRLRRLAWQDELLDEAQAEYEAYADTGSVEGLLRVLTSLGGFRIVIYDAISRRSVGCDIPDRLLQQALRLIGHRVELHGEIRYRRSGVVNRVLVQKIEALPPERDLPDHEEVRGILHARD